MSAATAFDISSTSAAEKWISIPLREFLIIVKAMALAATYPSPPATSLVMSSLGDADDGITWEDAAWQ